MTFLQTGGSILSFTEPSSFRSATRNNRSDVREASASRLILWYRLSGAESAFRLTPVGCSGEMGARRLSKLSIAGVGIDLVVRLRAVRPSYRRFWTKSN